MSAIGVSVPRVDGPAKVTGSAQYTADIELPGMLHAKVLRSTYPHARLVRVDASRAARLPGVVVLTRDDLQGMDPYYGPVVKDQPIVAIDKVRYVGDLVAAVAAEERDLAEEALDLVEVEYEPLPAVFDPIEAMRPEAPLLHERTADALAQSRAQSTQPGAPVWHLEASSNVCSRYQVEQGDLEAGFAQADEIFDDTYTVPTIQHGHMEPHAALAYWEASGKLVVYSSTQDPFEIRTELAQLFNLPQNQVRVIVPYLGGGYGAKIYPKLEPQVAALARKARRPVQWVLTREEVFLTIVRHAAVVHIKTGVKRDGTLLARRVEVAYDTGAYADVGPETAKNGGYAAGGPYRIPHQQLTSYAVYTNKPPAGAFRGFGVPQPCWAYESQMDDIARRLGLDPLALRHKNLVREGDTFVTGERLTSVGLADCLDRVAEAIDWGSADLRFESAELNSALSNLKSQISSPQHSGLVRGKGLACTIKSTMTPSNSAANLRLDADGTAQLLSSGVEIGQGCRTVLAQIVAETLELPVEHVTVSFPDTDTTPFDHGTKSSRITFSVGYAAHQAALQVRQQLLQAAAQVLETSEQDLELADGVVRVKGAPERGLTIPQVFQARFGLVVGSLFGGYDFQTKGGLDPATGKGLASVYWFWSAAGAEVEVDTATGKVRVVKAVSSVDAGKAINPRQCAMQQEGSTLMALGSALFEELAFDNGQPINASFLDYMLPSLEDCPESFQALLVEHPTPEGPFGLKGVGEPGLVTVAPAIGNAVANALAGVRIKDLPLRPDRVVAALRTE